ncbi:hypothetical protein [Amycolatopsis vancoresmycina]|uniref:DUF4331 domain-containing protein n=1 Tax=Amycolatopsis vancoresmycina DSM 44592 TaxID=1292037 RepID=R1I3W0_9PSEU|nr:hypothetical protein [Amycolatopsis vancoresmycina]EOD65169.1 hypothetical protein H480_28101 [Amycolatopsis vancoresmycina DSM 44592]
MTSKRKAATAVAAALTLGATAALSGGAQAVAQQAGGFTDRGDIRFLPQPLKDRLALLAGRPVTFPPMTAFSEAPSPSQLFQYYLLDTKNFQPNVFTTTIPGINDGVAPTATGPNHDLPTLGGLRVVVEPKPGLPTDPNDPGSFVDMFTDISGLFVINNESGWYEGWMIHDVTVPDVAALRADGHAAFGTITAADAAALAKMGDYHNKPGAVFTTDGKAPHEPSATDHWPDKVSNLVPIQLSLGAYNATQQSDIHSYWELNQYTNWVPPTYELPFTGGIPGTFEKGRIGALSSIVPGSGPAGVKNKPQVDGDNPNIPRDPDRLLNTSPDDPDRPMPNNDDHKEKRLRFVPSGLGNEVMLDVYLRTASFEPYEHRLDQRIFDAYAAEVARVDGNHDGIVDAVEADLEGTSDGGQSNDRLFLPATAYNRVAVTREINDGLLSPRFAPSQRAWVLSGDIARVSPSVPASIPQDGDNR